MQSESSAPSTSRSVSHVWSTLPAELSSLILSFAWDISQASSQYPEKRNPGLGVLCAVSTQWAKETRRCVFARLAVDTREDAQWLLDHLTEEAEGKLVWPFAALVKRVDIEGARWHIPDKAAYIAQLKSLVSSLPRLQFLKIHEIQPFSEGAVALLLSAAALRDLKELHLLGGPARLDIRPILESVARMPSVAQLSIHMYRTFKLDAPVPLPKVHTFAIFLPQMKDANESVQCLRRCFPSIPGGLKHTQSWSRSFCAGSSKGTAYLNALGLEDELRSYFV